VSEHPTTQISAERLHDGCACMSRALAMLGRIGVESLTALICVVWMLRHLRKESTRSLVDRNGGPRDRLPCLRVPVSLSRGVSSSLWPQSTFRGALLRPHCIWLGRSLAFRRRTSVARAFLCYQSVWLWRDSRKSIAGAGWWPVSRLGFRNATIFRDVRGSASH